MSSDAGEITSHAKVWFERDGKVVLSDWRAELLRAIDETGSLSAAARRAGVPYRTAWYKLREVEEQLGIALVETESGGASGGGSRLTTAGREVIERFERVARGVEELVRERFEEEFGEVRGGTA
jgi:molybdate transport system regulatory protein